MNKTYLLWSLPIVLILGLLSFMPNKNSITPKTDSFVLVQLFTSQGCSSCPPADKLLDKIKTMYPNNNVYVISYHVDYWDRLGWKDPFSKKEYTNLQYKYGNKFNTRTVYTPQAIVNGQSYFVGSNEVKMEENISKYLKVASQNSIEINNVVASGNKVKFNYSIQGEIVEQTLKVALVIDKKVTSVKRGENTGRNLINTNIVIEETTIKLSGKTGVANINIPKIANGNEQLNLIVYTQAADLSINGAIELLNINKQ